jgi:hypothetical protein
MEAILLSHDAQLGLAELVHKTYARLWRGHPFTFRVPCGHRVQGPALAYLSAQRDCRMISAPSSAIKATMAALLDGIDDRDWVYWCIDDRFPITLDPAGIGRIAAALDGLAPEVEEVKLLRWKEPLLRGRTTIAGSSFRAQAPGSRSRGFWHHHFVRSALLRSAFLREDLAADCAIGAINERIQRCEEHVCRGTALVARKPLLSLGEPVVERRLTRNGRAWLERMECEVPAYDAVDRDVVFR